MKRVLFCVYFCIWSCAEAPDTPDDHVHNNTEFVQSALTQNFERDTKFQQVGIMFDSQSDLEYLVHGEWQPVPVTFSEGAAKVGIVVLDNPTDTIEFRSEDGFTDATFQFYDEVIARSESIEPVEELRVTEQALAPAELVVTRSAWGARSPNRVCGSPHTPQLISVHHTALPASDGGDAPARMRQMQAYHIDSNNWCDIGYHFVVAQSGVIYQGRSTELRSGAHVGGRNTNNIGICMIGDYEANVPERTQLEQTSKILSWVADTYDIPFNRDVIKGHGEWAGQTTSCPGRNTLAVLDDIISDAEALTRGPLETCPELGENGGEIDNDSPCFQQFGPSEFWRVVEGQGVGNNLLWTNAWQTETPSNYARWNVNISTPGTYLVEYNSVDEFAVFNSTRYGVAHNSTEENVTVDQSAGTDGWNPIGEFDFVAGEGQWVSVYDNSPLAVGSDQHVIADAIRLTLRSDVVQIEQPEMEENIDGDDQFNNNLGENEQDDGTADPFEDSDPADIQTNEGCSTTGTSSPPSALLILFALFGIRRTRR